MRRKVRDTREKDSVLKLTECKDFGILSFLLYILSLQSKSRMYYHHLRQWQLNILVIYEPDFY